MYLFKKLLFCLILSATCLPSTIKGNSILEIESGRYFGYLDNAEYLTEFMVENVTKSEATGNVTVRDSNTRTTINAPFKFILDGGEIESVSISHRIFREVIFSEFTGLHSFSGKCIVGVSSKESEKPLYACLWLDRSQNENPAQFKKNRVVEIQEPDSYFIQHWITEDGLASNHCLDLIQSSDGTMWFATNDGLSQYDGVSWKTYSKATNPELEGSTFTAIAESPLKYLVVAVKDSGIYKLSNDNFELLHKTKDQKETLIKDLYIDKENNTYFNLNSKTTCLLDRNGRFVSWELDDFNADPIVSKQSKIYLTSQIINDKGEIMMSTNQGLKILNPESGKLRTFVKSISPTKAIKHLSDNSYVASFSDDLMVFDKKDVILKSYSIPDGHNLAAIFPRNSGGFWGASTRNLFLFKRGKLKSFNQLEKHIKKISTIYEDFEGGIWIAGAHNGVARIRTPKIQFRKFEESNLGIQPRSISASDSTGIVFSTPLNIGRLRNESLPLKMKVISDTILHEALGKSVSKPDAYWVGVSNIHNSADNTKSNIKNKVPILGYVEKNKIESFYWSELNNGLGQVYSVCDSGTSGIWMATNKGVIIFQNNEFNYWPPPEKLQSKQIICIYKEPDTNTVWLGGDDTGMIKLNDGGIDIINKGNSSLKSNTITSIFKDSKGVVWAGTDNGVCLVYGEHYKELRMSPKTENKTVRTIIEDDEYNIWIGLSNGISCVINQGKNHFETAAKATIISFGKLDGLINTSILPDYYPVSCKSNDGRLFFVTENGLAIIDPEVLLKTTKPVPIQLKSLSFPEKGRNILRNIPISADTKSIDLPPPASEFLKIKYSRSSFNNAGEILFRYRIPEISDEWITTWNQKEAILTNLDPGKYTFEINSINRHGLLDPQIASLDIQIQPYFYQTLFFKIAIIIAVSSGLWFSHRRIVAVNTKIKDLEKVKELEEERSRIARDMHDEVGSSLAQIRLLAERQKSLDINGSGKSELNERIAGAALKSSETLREIIWSLNPKKSGYDDFCNYIRMVGTQIFEDSVIQFQFHSEGPSQHIHFSSLVRRQLTLIIKGIMSNTLQHSRSKLCQCEISLERDSLMISCYDDGIGFEEENISEDSLGLQFIKERVESMHGTFVVHSSIGKGTKCKVKIPYNTSGIHIIGNRSHDFKYN